MIGRFVKDGTVDPAHMVGVAGNTRMRGVVELEVVRVQMSVNG